MTYKILDTKNNKQFKPAMIGLILEGEQIGEYIRVNYNNDSILFLASELKEVDGESNNIEVAQYDGVTIATKTKIHTNWLGEQFKVVAGISIKDIEGNNIYKYETYNSYIMPYSNDDNNKEYKVHNLKDIMDDLTCYLNNCNDIDNEFITDILLNKSFAISKLKRFVKNYYKQLELNIKQELNKNVLKDNDIIKIELINNNITAIRKLDNKQFTVYKNDNNYTIEQIKESNIIDIIEAEYGFLDSQLRYKLNDVVFNDTNKEGRLNEVTSILQQLFNEPIQLEESKKYLGEGIYRHTYKGYIKGTWTVISKGWYNNTCYNRCSIINYGNTEYNYPISKGLKAKIYHHIYG